jgi:hypothetical protein
MWEGGEFRKSEHRWGHQGPTPAHQVHTCDMQRATWLQPNTKAPAQRAQHTPQTAQEAKNVKTSKGGGLAPPLFASMQSQVGARVLRNAAAVITVITKSPAQLLPQTSASMPGT